jgi:hypothetical protein
MSSALSLPTSSPCAMSLTDAKDEIMIQDHMIELNADISVEITVM